MNEELLVSLAEAMLNEGINEDSIINVLSNLVEEQEEVLPVSESCFNSIVSLTEAIINELHKGTPEQRQQVVDRKVNQLKSDSDKLGQEADHAYKRADFDVNALGARTRKSADALRVLKDHTRNASMLHNGAKRIQNAAKKQGLNTNAIDQARPMYGKHLNGLSKWGEHIEKNFYKGLL